MPNWELPRKANCPPLCRLQLGVSYFSRALGTTMKMSKKERETKQAAVFGDPEAKQVEKIL